MSVLCQNRLIVAEMSRKCQVSGGDRGVKNVLQNWDHEFILRRWHSAHQLVMCQRKLSMFLNESTAFASLSLHSATNSYNGRCTCKTRVSQYPNIRSQIDKRRLFL